MKLNPYFRTQLLKSVKMSFFKPGQKYGLIMPKKKDQQQTRANPLKGSNMVQKGSIFGADSSDSDDNTEDASGDWVAKSMKVKANNTGLKKQSKIQMSKALEEDPTVFQYDEVYDDIERKKVEEKETKKEVDRKPKYVHNLLKAADQRQKEFERRIERQVQKEREAEGDMYADKESFVTSAYRKKMEEMAEQEEEEARQARIEAALDVTKQNNMDGFYRHLYRQTMGEEKGQKEEKPELTEEERAAKVKEEMKKIKIDEENKKEEEESSTTIKKIDKKKGFRKKEVVESSSDEEFSSGESDSDDDDNTDKNPGKDVPMSAEEKFEKRKQELREQREKREKRKRKIEEDASSRDSEDDEADKKRTKDDTKDDAEVKEENPDDVVEVKPEVKPKINIWEKRTVGEMFDEAVRRYWERKSARDAGR